MLLSLHLNVWQHKCINIPIYFYMSMIYRCLCVCECMCLNVTRTLTNQTSSRANAIHIFTPENAVALHYKTVSICLKTGGYWCAQGEIIYITIQLDSELDWSALSFPSPSVRQMLAHTHTYLHMYACTPYDCVSNKLSLLWRRSFRMRKMSVNSSTGMLTMCNISKQEIIEKIKDLTQRLVFL